MAKTLKEVLTIIHDCVDNNKTIGIISDKKLIQSLTLYMHEYEGIFEIDDELARNISLMGTNNVNDDYLFTLQCVNGKIMYRTTKYSPKSISVIVYDELYMFSDKAFAGFNRNNYSCRNFSFNGYIKMTSYDIYKILSDMYANVVDDIKEIESEEIVDNIDDKFTVELSNPILDIFNEIFNTPRTYKPTVTDKPIEQESIPCAGVCCVECKQIECEFQGDASDCECDKCIEIAIANCKCEDCIESGNEECEECNCEDGKLIEKYMEAINEVDGCEDCIEDLLSDLISEARELGWNEHREYMNDCNKVEY